MDGFRPPQYAPGQSPELMNDPMGLMVAMFGMPLMQQAAGPANFVPHFTPSQALTDQFTASRYQRDTMKSMSNSAEQGNAEVASRLLGIRSLVTDAPATQLNREQASNMASIVNNPIAKAVMGAAMGPENMEAVMFGRKGDPSALDASASRMNFFRKDTMGGSRMTAQSMSDFSTNLHQHMYGEGANLGDMHGFMAGQTGQLVENLFQRGALPQALGQLSPAERVKAVSAVGRDEKTTTRLAEQFGHSEMMKQDDYAKGTTEERKKMLDARMPEFKERMGKTLEEVDKFRAGDKRAKSPQEIEKMDGYGISASSVDAGKVGDVAKKYTGAIDAIREIFGDGGRGDAPMQELIHALDHLSSGSIGQVGTAKVENVMRQMRVAARDTGMGFEQMAGLSAQVSAHGDTLGLARPLSMETTLQAVQMQRSMRDAGAFSGNVWGRMDMNEATSEAGARINRGKASSVGMSMAAMNRMYDENQELYKGTELEAAMKAYNDPSSGGKYTFDGKEKNIAEMMGRGGKDVAQRIVESSGGNVRSFESFYYDKKGTQEYQRSGHELTAQRAEMQRDISNHALRGFMIDRMSSDEFADLRPKGGFMGRGAVSPEEFEKQRNDLADTFSDKMSQVMLEETGSMSQKDRAVHMEKRHKEVLKDIFVSRGVDERTATKRADETSTAMFGDNEGKRREAFSAMSAEANTYVEQRTGQQISGNDQLYSPAVQENMRQNVADDANRAERMKAMSHGHQSTMLQRAGETLAKMGEDPNYTGAQAAKDIMNIQPIDQMRDRYAPELAGSFKAAGEMYKGAKTAESKARVEKVMAGLYGGRNESMQQEGAAALAEEVFGKGKTEDAALLQRAVAGNEEAMTALQERVTAVAGSGKQGEEKAARAMELTRGLRDAKKIDLAGAGFGRTAQEEFAPPKADAEQAAQAATAASAAAAQPESKITQASEADKLRTVGAAQESALAVGETVAYQRADKLAASIGGEEESAPRADGPRIQFTEEDKQRFQEMRQRAIDRENDPNAEQQRVGSVSGVLNAAKSALPFVQAGVAASAVYGNASEASAALANSEQFNHGQAIAATAQGVGDFVDGAGAAAGVASGALAKAGVLTKTAQTAGKFSSALGTFGKVNAFLSPLIGGVAGAFEGASNGRGALEGGILGALTGDASTGSALSGFVGIEKGTTADKTMGVGGAAAVGALTGAGIGGVIGGALSFGTLAVPAAAVGAGIGAVAGGAAELYKWATEPQSSAATQSPAAVDAIQRTVSTTQNNVNQAAQAPQSQGGKELTINGTLSLRGLTEAVLSASGDKPMETPGGGAPVFSHSGM
jgi:hypothetical protein